MSCSYNTHSNFSICIYSYFFCIELVPNVNVFDAGVNIDVPPPTPKLNPELSTNVVIPENIGPESVIVTVLKTKPTL